MKISVNKRCIIWVCLFLLLLRPAGLVHILNIGALTRMLCMIISAFIFPYSVCQKKITVPNIWYIIYVVYLFLCTLFNGTRADIREMLSVAVCNIGMICFVNYIIFIDTYNGLKAMYLAYLILIISNFIYIIANPHGYNLNQWNLYGRGYYLFGYQNSIITYAMPAICVALIAGNKKIIKRWQSILLIALSVALIVMVFSATSLVGLAIFFIVLLLMQKRKMKKLLNATCAMILGTALSIGIVFFNIQTRGFAAWVITNVLNRSTSLTSRTVIWQQTLSVIRRNWLFGIGYKINTAYQAVIHGSSAHNEYLFMLLQGGIVLLVIFYVYFAVMKKPLEKYKTSYVTYVFTALYFSLFIQFIAETHMHRIAPLLALVGCANKLIDGNNSDRGYQINFKIKNNR